jgi:hypothetical protein
MSTANGAPVTREDVIQARRRLALTQTQLSQSKLDKITKLQESISLPDMWLGAQWDALSRNKQDADFSGWRRTNRKAGRNYPIFEDEEQLGNIREMSRILAAHNGYAKGLISGLVSYVLGNGFIYRIGSASQKAPAPDELIDAAQDVIDEFLERTQWHGGEMPAMEEELVRRAYIDGEFFVATTLLDQGLTDVRSIEPELVTAPVGMKDGPDWWTFGIQADPDDVQKHLSYWVGWCGKGAADGQEYLPDKMTHLRRNVVRSIKRGLPDLYGDTLHALHTASALRKNMAEGAAIQASYAGIRQHDSATKEQVEDFRSEVADYTSNRPTRPIGLDYHQKFEPGMVDIPKGLNFVLPPTATNAAAHVEILQACLRAGGTWANAPEWLVSGLHDTSSFASSLTAESPFLRLVVRDQRAFKSAFLRIMWTVLQNRVKAGLTVLVRGGDWAATGRYSERVFTWLEVERLLDIQVEAPSPETRDKAAEAQSNLVYLNSRVKSAQTVQGELGLDSEQELVNMEEFQERLGDAGLPLPLPPSTFGKINQPLPVVIEPQPLEELPDEPENLADAGLAAVSQAASPDDAAKALAATVGGSQAIIALQTQYYAGELPRSAALANARILFGFNQADADMMFPVLDAPVVKESVQPAEMYRTILERLTTGRQLLEQVNKPPEVNVNVNVPKQDPQPAPIVNATITLQEQATPAPTININVPPQPPPVVQVENIVNVPPAAVPQITVENVVQPAPVVVQPSGTPKRGKRRVAFGKDSTGKITDATIEDA